MSAAEAAGVAIPASGEITYSCWRNSSKRTREPERGDHALAEMGVRGMHSIKLVAVAGLASLFASQAFAEDTMGTMTMMKGGQVTAIMPDGHMGTMMPDAKMSAEMMKMAKPIKHCMMIITDAKGKAYMIDTSTKKAQAECEKMAM
ncbi:hypothetical protein [Mesorhizobium sp.]|uniref:hypothetical protein n=1 Tax=Mesorhizobium sp. TaxID=1871066 RepID=UPI0025C5445C|nr:hypothetical protein [Mesorhizobium sp.]